MSRTIREQVEDIMELYPNTRNDDNLLTVKYWQLHCGLTREQAVFMFNFMKDAVSMDSITRARRLIQAEGQLVPTNEVVAQRRSREIRMRNAVMAGGVV